MELKLNNSFNVLNDYFVRYLFSDKGSEVILLDFINSIMLDSNMKTLCGIEEGIKKGI